MTPRQWLKCAPAAAVLVCAACAQNASETPKSEAQAPTESAEAATPRVTLQSPITTRKPGASVTFHHGDVAMIDAGATGAVTLTINEGYPAGKLSLSASGDPGLTVFGQERELEVDMAAGTSHTWRLNYTAEADGAYYINLFAMVEPGDGTFISRSSAVMVKIGNWDTVEAGSEAANTKTTLLDGEPAIIMDAEETIE